MCRVFRQKTKHSGKKAWHAREPAAKDVLEVRTKLLERSKDLSMKREGDESVELHV